MMQKSNARLQLKLKTFITIGDKLIDLSTCTRAKVSAIIFPIDFSAIYAIGYNGPPRGMSNNSCTGAPGQCGCPHAEANALIKFNANVAKSSLMYATHHPCQYCAELILNCEPLIGLIYGEQMDNVRSELGHDLLCRAQFPTFQKVEVSLNLPEKLVDLLFNGKRPS